MQIAKKHMQRCSTSLTSEKNASQNHIEVPVASTCHPSYSGGSDQEDHGLKRALNKKVMRSNLEKNHHKKGLAWNNLPTSAS
jgi:ribosomal protein L31